MSSPSSLQKDSKPKKTEKLNEILLRYELPNKPRYISREFQEFGCRLAKELDDTKHTSMYIRFAKQMDRGILEQALFFVKGAAQVKSKSRLFMWKLKQLNSSGKTASK